MDGSQTDNKPVAVPVRTHPSAEKAELQRRLAVAREQREQTRLLRESRETENGLLKKVTEEERAAKDEEVLAGLEAEHGVEHIGVVQTDLGMIVLKRPNHLLFKKFQDKNKQKSRDFEQLVRPSILHPNKNRYDSIIEQLPATLMRCADRVCVLAGVRLGELEGK